MKPRTIINSAIIAAGLVLLVVSCSGCCYSHGKVTRPDGIVTEFSNYRAIWSTDAYKFGYTSNSITLDVQKSNPDAQTVAALKDLILTIKP